MQDSVDPTLLIRTARGDDTAARLLWALLGPRLIGFATGLLHHYGGHVAACDVVQAVFCRVVGSGRGSLYNVTDVAAWMARAVRNESLNYIRSSKRRDAHMPEAGVMTPGVARASGAGQTLAAVQTFGELHAALDVLPEGLREIMLLKHVAGLTFDQMAISLDENRNTVASRYAKALRMLREHMNGPTQPSPAQRQVEVKHDR